MDAMGLLQIFESLPEGKSIRRKKLVEMTGDSDRKIREDIKKLRRLGHHIVPNPKGGYYLTDNPAVWNRFCEQQARRACNTFEKPEKDVPGQVKMDVTA